ncbi:MAG: ATP-binding protein [Candidatus Omnitrophica bacterium]|nr:ATP-binding protein [Candidatus Omnitrophota bacterium]MDD5671808.1 ATP-binding protein [Candidatus Omnitrophota bacterium]
MKISYYFAASGFFNSLFAIFLVYYIFLRNKKNPLNRSFLYFGIAVAGWSLFYSVWCMVSDGALAERLIRTYMLFATLIPATFFHFAAHFTDTYERHKKSLIVIYTLGFCYSAAALTPLMISGVRKAMFFDFWPSPGPLLLSHVIYFVLVVLYGFGLLAAKYHRSDTLEKKRTLIVLIGFIIGFGGGVTNYFLWFDIPVPPFMNFCVGITFAMIAYAMVRYGLMDVDAVVETVRANRLSVLGLLSASINHELKNPLYIAQGLMESYQDSLERNVFASPEARDEACNEMLRKVLYQLNRALDIMHGFSNLARVDDSPRKIEQVSVHLIYQNVKKMLAHELEIRKIRLIPDGIDDLELTTNRREFEEILFNLFVNACHAIDGEGEIRLEGRDSGTAVTLEISDTGCGIPGEDQSRIFEPLFSTKSGHGTGLGLYIVKQLVERNNGRISFKSEAGRGTTFKLEFKR